MENPIKMDDFGVPLFSETPYNKDQPASLWKKNIHMIRSVSSLHSDTARHFGTTKPLMGQIKLVVSTKPFEKYANKVKLDHETLGINIKTLFETTT